MQPEPEQISRMRKGRVSENRGAGKEEVSGEDVLVMVEYIC